MYTHAWLTQQEKSKCVLTMMRAGGSKPWGTISSKFAQPQATYRFYLESKFAWVT